MDDRFSEDEQEQETKRMRVTQDHLSYANVLVAPQPAGFLDHCAFALSIETIYSKHMELPTITQLVELICAEHYKYAHEP